MRIVIAIFFVALVISGKVDAQQSSEALRQQEADAYFAKPPSGPGASGKEPYLPPYYPATQNGTATRSETLPPLFEAAKLGLRPERGAVERISKLLNEGADPSQLDSKGQTAIFALASMAITPREYLYPQEQETMYRDWLSVARAYHLRGADLGHKDNDGRTALHVAAAQCNPHGVLMMAALGIDPLSFGRDAMTAEDIVKRIIRDQGGSKACQQVLDLLRNPDLIRYWRRIYQQTASK